MDCENDIEQCGICRRPLERKGDDWDMLCPNCADAVSHFLDETGLSEEHVNRLVELITTVNRRARGTHCVVRVPTYYGHAYADAVLDGLIPESGKPFVPIALQEMEGLRLVLGSSEPIADAPDIHLERRPNGWALFLHPESGGDPSGYVYLIDDGRSFIVPERGTTPAIEICEWEQVVGLVDRKTRT